MSGGPPVLVARGLSRRFGATLALDAASLSVAPGEFVALLGESGSGKTTLFRCLARLSEPDSGSVVVAGRPVTGVGGRALREARRGIGVVFQGFNLIGRRTALANVLTARLADTPFWRVATGSFRRSDRRDAFAALAAVGMAEKAHQRAATLSGGQRQRVAIARALCQNPSVVLADEPVASLDPDNADGVMILLRRLADERGLAVVCTLHQPDLAERFADRILRMRNGRIVGEERIRREAPACGQPVLLTPSP